MFIEVAVTLFVIWYLACYFHFDQKPSGAPPGTLGWPLVGIYPPTSCSFEEHINRYRKKYGDTFWMKMGSRNVVFICEPKIIISAFNNPAIQGRPAFFSFSLFYKEGIERGIAFAQGIPWKDARRFSQRRLRDSGMGKSSLSSIILTEAEALSKDFEKNLGPNSQLPMSINVSILNVIWKLVADQRFDITNPESEELFSLVTDLFTEVQNNLFLLFDLMPWVKTITPICMQNVFGRKSFQEKIDKIHTIIYKTVDRHKKTLDENNPRDLIDSYLIELNKKDANNQSEFNKYFSENELACVIFDLFITGSEPTSSTLRWYILLMAKYPEVQRKVQMELDKVISEDKRISMDDKEKVPFFEATISETLRLKSSITCGIFHTVTEETTIDGYLIPKDTYVMADLQACHKNPKLWEKPNEFYPEHFLNEDGTFNNNKHGSFSFGSGKRICENLARMDLYFILATLMTKFTFEPPEGEPLSIEQYPDQLFFTIPKPFKIIINKR